MKHQTLVLFTLLAFLSGDAEAQFQTIAVSADTTVEIDDQRFEHQEIVQFATSVAAVSSLDLGQLPSRVDIDAYHRTPEGDHLFSIDVAAELPGGVLALPGDVVRFDGVAYSIEFDSRGAGLSSVDVDALTANAQGDLILSFTSAISIGGATAEDEDLLRWDGESLSLLLPLRLVGVPGSLDLDALHRDFEAGFWYFSFDTSWQIDGKIFDDEHVVRLDILSSTWQLVPLGQLDGEDWGRADLDALHLAVDPHLIFADGFEGGTPSAWDEVMP